MQKLLKELSEIYIKLNKNFDEKLINHAELVDINEDIIDIFPQDCARLEQGIERMKKLKFILCFLEILLSQILYIYEKQNFQLFVALAVK